MSRKERYISQERAKKASSCTILVYFFVDSFGNYHQQETLIKNGQAALLYHDPKKGAQIKVWKDINKIERLAVSEDDIIILKLINTHRGQLNVLDWMGRVQQVLPTLYSSLEDRGRWYTYRPDNNRHHFFVGFGKNPKEAREALENAFQRATSVKPDAFPRTALEHNLSY